MNTPGDRLRNARRAAGFKTQREACQRYGWNENTYRTHENGPRGISKSAALEYARVFKVSVAWLLTGQEMETEGHDVRSNEEAITHGALGVRVVPVVALSEAAAMEEDDFETLNNKKIDKAALLGAHYSRTTRATRMNDRSMTAESMDAIPEGADVIYDRGLKASPGDQVVARVPDVESAIIRKFTEPEPGLYVLEPLNKEFPVFKLQHDMVKFMSPIIEVHTKRRR